MTPPLLPALGALAAWRARVKRNPRSIMEFDALHYAASCELNGLEAERDGLPLSAAAWYRDAAAKWQPTRRQEAPAAGQSPPPRSPRPFALLRPTQRPRWSFAP